MRQSFRNTQVFWYALFGQVEEQYDEWGNIIGQGAGYGKPVKTRGNISPAKGEATTRQFGEDTDYDRVIVIDDPETPIDETTVIWVDITPELDQEGNLAKDTWGNYLTPYNYRVKTVGRGLPKFGATQIAIKHVSVS